MHPIRPLSLPRAIPRLMASFLFLVSCGSENKDSHLQEQAPRDHGQSQHLGSSALQGVEHAYTLAPSFTDLSGDVRAREIEEAARLGFVHGFPDGSFKPLETITREQMAAVLFNALSAFGLSPTPAPRQVSGFPDVPTSRWSYRAIDTLHQLGVVSGLPGGRFEPASPVTRAQVAVMVHGLLKSARSRLGKTRELPVVVVRRSYIDVGGHWAAASIAELSGYCHAETAVETTSDTFHPDAQASRSLATGSLVRALICLKTGALPEWVERGGVPTDSLSLCESRGAAQRAVLVRGLASAPIGTRDFDLQEWAGNREACVLGLIPAALFVNLKTGVPASTLVGQAIQETGWCRSQLAREGLNFHGQKAKFSPSYFRYWDGSFVWINSTESPTGEGNKQLSKFMSFEHPDHSFYAVAERFILPGLPYNACMSLRSNPDAFIDCVGKTWAVHSDYADVVRRHIDNFRSESRPALRLRSCDLKPEEWQLDERF